MATYTERRDPLVTCPYNPAHQVKKGRLQIHINKCRKSYPEKDLRHCPFSAEHMVPASDLMHHIYTCPLNTTVERFLTASEKDSLSGDITIPPVAGNAMQQQDVPLEENWDEEATGVASLEDKIPAPAVAPIFINVQAMTPAERRHYYASLHSIADKKVPAHMRPYPQPAPRPGASNPLQRNETAMPPVPKTDPKVLQGLQLAQMTAKAQYAAAMDSDSDDDDDDDDDSDELDEADQSQAYRMGVGRGHVTSPKAAGADTDTEDKEIRSRVQLLGLGRGRPVQRNRPT